MYIFPFLLLLTLSCSTSPSAPCDFLHCKEESKCMPLVDEHYNPIRKECDGECVALNSTCSGSCGAGQCLEGGECRLCSSTSCAHPRFCHKDGKCLETVQLYEEKANATSVKSCKGECVALDKVCENDCGLPWQCQKDDSCVSTHKGGSQTWEVCDGQCLPLGGKCSTSCLKGMCKLGGKCLPMVEEGKRVRWECDGKCTNISSLCEGGCGGGGRCLEGQQCLPLDQSRGECDGRCHPTHLPCNRRCAPGHCLQGSTCLPLGEAGRQVRSECDGQCSPRDLPCQGKCPPDMCQESGRCLDLLDKEFKIVRKECNGQCLMLGGTCVEENKS